jgi:hypothetical protein
MNEQAPHSRRPAMGARRRKHIMGLTTDQMSKLGAAWEAASTAADRRRSQRIKQRVTAEISPWKGNRAGTAFGVTLEDFSTTGVGIVHCGRLQPGSQYLLEIPRPGDQGPLRAIFTAVRCSETDGGLFNVRMEPSELLDVAVDHAARAKGEDGDGSRRVILILVTILFAASAAAVFFDLL